MFPEMSNGDGGRSTVNINLYEDVNDLINPLVNPAVTCVTESVADGLYECSGGGLYKVIQIE